MTLDEQVLAQAKEARQRLVDLESQTAHVRVDYHHAIKKLHAAGGSLREIADALELSHQRVHQIVDGPAGPAGGPPWGGRRWRRGHRGGNRRFFIARFDDDARKLLVEAQKEADSLKHPYLGTEHLMLALVEHGVEGVDYQAARAQVLERVGEGDQEWIAGLPRPFTPRAKQVLAEAKDIAVDAGREQFGTDDILLAMVSDSQRRGRRDPPRPRRHSRAAARAARPIADAAASPPPFTSTSKAAARAAASASRTPALASPLTALSVVCADSTASSAVSAASSAIRSGNSIVRARASSECVVR